MRNLVLTLMIWVLAFTAITAGVLLSYNWYKEQGSEISIQFEDASGLVPGQSKLLYRGVQVGTVKGIVLDDPYGDPVLHIRVQKNVAAMFGKDSKFWVVRPHLGLGQVRNLSAISTGDYVSVEPAKGDVTTHFIGSEEEPIDPLHADGLQLTLKASSVNGVNLGTAIEYHGLKIGEVGGLSLANDNRTILIHLTIDKRYSRVVRKGSYFGNISGFHTSLQLFGENNIDVNSLNTLVSGAISVFTPDLRAPLAQDGAVYWMMNPAELRAKRGDSCK